MKPLVLIPAFNEAATLPAVVEEIRSLHPEIPILVVDDASTDGSGELVPRLGVRHLQLGQHVGLGGALRTGLRYARTLGRDTVIRLDGDGQHPAAAIDALLHILREGQADAVVGSRFAGNRPAPPVRPLLRLSQGLLGWCLTRLTGRPVTDPTSGLWVFGLRAVRLLGDHYPPGYSEPELRLFLHRNGLRVSELEVAMRPRQGGRSTLSPGRVLLATARTTLAILLVPLRASIFDRSLAE